MSHSITKISSGADHDKVAALHLEWDEFDWCRYWELDARKGYRKAGIKDPGLMMDCGDPRCKCKTMNKGN